MPQVVLEAWLGVPAVEQQVGSVALVHSVVAVLWEGHQPILV